MTVRDPVRIVLDANLRFRGRYDEPLRRKIERMSASAFDFLRGSACLFARDLRERHAGLDPDLGGLVPAEGPIVGDLHCENYGTFKAEDGDVRYDVDDFDEAARGTPAIDAVRGATSLLLLASRQGFDLGDAVRIAGAFARAWAGGFSRADAVAARAVRRLVREVEKVKRTRFIEKITRFKDGRRSIVRDDHFFDLRPVHRAQAFRLLEDYRARVKGGGFFTAEDVSGRIVGCGSLGKLRYAVLVTGDGSRDAKNVLLEFKEALPSWLDPERRDLRSRAGEIIGLQRAMQSSSDRHLGLAVDGAQSFLVHEIGPRNDRLSWDEVRGLGEFVEVAALQGRILAKGHLRAGIAHRAVTGLATQRILGFALGYAAQVEDDHRAFVARRTEIRRALLG